jgi:hypothetical protein
MKCSRNHPEFKAQYHPKKVGGGGIEDTDPDSRENTDFQATTQGNDAIESPVDVQLKVKSEPREMEAARICQEKPGVVTHACNLSSQEVELPAWST